MSKLITELSYREVHDLIRNSGKNIHLSGCLGQRFIGAGMSAKKIVIEGTPGNAMGAYLNGAEIEVFGNAQDAVGDTMNSGRIVIHGNIGDAAGYAMRGGEIFIEGNAGYRAGIHMKEYRDKIPVIVIGGRAGSFLGEYQAGGIIIVLGLNSDGRPIVSNFPGTGMHGGRMYLRGNAEGIRFPDQVKKSAAEAADKKLIKPYIDEFAKLFNKDARSLMDDEYTLITPDSSNPYKQLYVAN